MYVLLKQQKIVSSLFFSDLNSIIHTLNDGHATVKTDKENHTQMNIFLEILIVYFERRIQSASL
jgi:hypothetical protein